MRSTAFTMLLALACSAATAAERHAEPIVRQILENAAKIKAADPTAVPMAFWDFDGTIIKGDVSEGLVENGVTRFKGLVQRTIEEGYSSVYRSTDGWKLYSEKDYPRLNEIGRWIAWPYNAQIYAGTRVADLDAFCVREYERVYRKWYFTSSIAMLHALEKAGVENYVVSASPELFVANAAATLPLPRERLRGIRVRLSAGYVTTDVVHPVPMGEGKIEVVRELVLSRPHGVAVAAFGNSYSTDGAFLRYVAKQPSLPGGAKGTSVMVNGGKVVPGYTEHFICVDQNDVVGGAELGVQGASVPSLETFISHRGESVDAPENTLPAYKTAVSRGFGFECDIYLSKDGRVFTFHDRTLTRTSGGANTNKCNDATWDEVAKLDVGNWGKWKGSKFAGTRPALLEEVLELTRDGRWLYIDVKSKTADIVPYVKAIFERQKKANPKNTLFLCGSVECGKAFKKLMPEYKVLSCLNCNKSWKMDAKPEPVENIIAVTKEMGADGVDLRFIRTVTTPEYMKAIKDAGLELHVWTIDELDDAVEAFKRGAQTVTTNCAKKLLDEYTERKTAR